MFVRFFGDPNSVKPPLMTVSIDVGYLCSVLLTFVPAAITVMVGAYSILGPRLEELAPAYLPHSVSKRLAAIVSDHFIS